MHRNVMQLSVRWVTVFLNMPWRVDYVFGGQCIVPCSSAYANT